MDNYRFGNIMLQWDGRCFELARGRYLECFRCKTEMSEEILQFRGQFVSLDVYTQFQMLTENSVYALFDVHGEHLLIYHWGNRRFAFAIWPERIRSNQVNECWFDPDMVNQPKLNADWFFGVSGLHKALLQRGAAVLHASYIDRNGQAILFVAPSGTGKSTQAALWEKYAGAEVINGDRVLVRQCAGRWYAFGYPCCGSSKICLNRTLPLRIIVVLKQGVNNCIGKLTIAQKIRLLTAATEVYPWDTAEINRAMDLMEAMVKTVPVIGMSCQPDKGAVEVLNQYLEENNNVTGY